MTFRGRGPRACNALGPDPRPPPPKRKIERLPGANSKGHRGSRRRAPPECAASAPRHGCALDRRHAARPGPARADWNSNDLQLPARTAAHLHTVAAVCGRRSGRYTKSSSRRRSNPVPHRPPRATRRTRRHPSDSPWPRGALSHRDVRRPPERPIRAAGHSRAEPPGRCGAAGVRARVPRRCGRPPDLRTPAGAVRHEGR
ncbi:MAG: hypothetical protein QOJ91_1236 [Sphingomonadales bacterium]|nr:hypothetical protein [Sphingomonadales bacterium]